MHGYIILLRGINVSGQKKMPMAELREALTQGGFVDVKTYIQSGNVILKSAMENNEKVALEIEKCIQKQFGFEVPVLCKTREQFQAIFDACPFPEEKKEKSYFMLLYEKPSQVLVDEVSQITYPDEEFVITPNCIYLFSGVGYGNSKFNNNFFERKLKIPATARNYNTMVKLLSLSSE